MWSRSVFALVGTAVALVSAQVQEIDILPLLPFRPYHLPRMRWTDLNRVLGEQASEKMIVSKPMDTMLGKINVPKEDQKAFNALSAMEVKSLHGDAEFVDEKQVWIAFDLIHEGDIPSAIELLDQVKEQASRQFGTKHPLYANALADLGYAYMKQKDYIKSNSLLVEAMELDEELQDKFGVYNTAASINLMAASALASGAGNFNALSNAYEAAFNALHKESHASQFEILMNLANMYRLHWLPLRSINMFKLAKQYAPNPSVKYADLLVGLGASYIMEGEFQQGHRILLSAVDMYESLDRHSSHGHLEATYYLATSELLQKKYGAALARFQAARKALTTETFPCAKATLMTSIGACIAAMGYTDMAIGMLDAANALLSAHATTLENELFAPYIHLKIDHLLATLWDQDKQAPHAKQQKHAAAAYEAAVTLFGDTHALAVAHKVV
ncbi:hypothetical protein H257_05567 [Aphanomyces astaci]|uniref:MalT-like TPR region domain-containing protein n=1 Tax=Aphanomyces astaci TaxID=112090 RepID=W4GT69_APHAT|nr:hypothetical protein H257_05567 [Aphanomyces astaci]ETV82048.1 hypothetical protein H257_05567 [Aphanomyces astaci]|eukprot:XP_009828785.1 hypothetical protein H257_05567 [Aphanomyces astaci]